MAVTSFTAKDPFRQVLEAIVSRARKQPRFRKLVERGNVIDYTGEADRSPDKENPTTADYPIVRFRSGGFEARLFDTGGAGCQGGSKGSSSITYRVVVETETGDKRSNLLTGIDWAILQAIAKTRDNDTTQDPDAENNLGLDFVSDVRVEGAGHGDRNPDGTPIGGWISLLAIVVEMAIDNELELQA